MTEHTNGPEEPAATTPALVELASRVFDTARRGAETELRAYLDAGIPVNLTNDRGDTLLMLASYHGHTPLVRLLCTRGAEVDRRNDRDHCPLAGAVFTGEDEVVRVLVEHGADAHAGTPTALEAARMFGQDHLVDLLQRPR